MSGRISWLGPLLVVVGLILGGVMAFGAYQSEANVRAQITPESTGPLVAPAPITLQAEPGDATKGNVGYDKICTSCHGTLGDSDIPLRGSVLNAYYPNDGAIAAIVRSGYGDMPPVKVDKLSDQQLADTIAFIRTFP